jgi:hypothetical protein
LVLAMSNVFQTKKEFTLAYRPQSNGQTERKNRTIKAELTKRCHQLGKNWAPYLKWIEFAYNTTPHSAHGYTPHFLMFGQQARIPTQYQLPEINTKGWYPHMKTYVREFLDRVALTYKIRNMRPRQYQEQMTKQHDKKTMERIEK